MDWNVLQRCQYKRWASDLATLHFIRADLCWLIVTGWMLASSMLLVAADTMPSEKSQDELDGYRQGILQAHPEWPPNMLAAAMAGIICVGMPADMVRVAWGHPTHTSGRGEPGQRETWHYAGRPSAVERLAGQGLNAVGSSEWTVSFIDGRVVAWTD
jgi:hypothetical protein